MSPQFRRSPKGDAARSRILQAAVGVYAELGYYGGSIRRVAETAGIPVGTVVHHFPKKSALYAAVLARLAEELNGLIVPVLEPDDVPYLVRLEGFVDAYLDWAWEHPAYTRILLRELLDNQARLEEGEVTFHLNRPMEHMIAFVRAGQKAGAFEPVEGIYFVVHFVGSVSFFFAARPSLARLIDSTPALERGRFRDELQRLARRILIKR